MSPTSQPLESRTLAFLGALFILLYFIFFSYRGLFSYFTFDDGTTVIYCLKPFETPLWRDLLHILTVFTKAFRPLTTLFWRPLYALFGFNPLPYRIVVHLLLTVSIGVAYVLARRLDATREGAALTALVFCYNAATFDLYYNTCLVDYVICFLLSALAVIVYVRGRQAGEPLGLKRTAAVVAFYLLALDTKELGVTLPGILLLYEVLYRRSDFRDRRKTLRVAGLLAAMFVAAAIYLSVKVPDMSHNSAYAPHLTVGFVVNNVGRYLEQLLYLRENSVTPLKTCLILGGLIAGGALVGSRQAIFGVLFFVAALIPVAVIASRGAYAAYAPYFGLALAAGSIIAGARSRLTALTRGKVPETAAAVVVFLGIAILLGWAHLAPRMAGNGYYEWSNPQVIGLMDGFRQNIPEFPPNARVLLRNDPWGSDWGPMFLVRLLYHNDTVWVDRPKNMDHPPDLASYDLVVSYQPPEVELSPALWHNLPMKWEIQGKTTGTGQFSVSSPNAHGAAAHVDFVPQSVKRCQTATIKVPGLSGVAINVLYRMASETKSTPHLVTDWCTLDATGACTIDVPCAGAGSMIVDWIQPAGQRWIFSSGLLKITK